MPSKYQEYRQMADTAERQLTSSYKSWTQFLRTAARLYKYPYNEQVMIHAQRPDATACAEYDFWNKKMPDRLQNVRNTLDATTAQMEAAKAELGKPFPQEEELRVKSARLAELNAELNIDERTPMEQLADDAAISAKAERPSVLARLKNTQTRQTQDTPEKQREQESR